uniref:Helix-hairpin-helix domain-containing protein n=1 Tax=Prevotella sp. GTC17260 TaxID=3236796 RepID=A0AB33JC29_9BACT
MLKHGILSVCLSLCFFVGKAQTADDWKTYYDEIGTLDDVETATWEETYDVLNELAGSKLNLNTATQQDLERIPFLSAQQIEDIVAYIYRYAPLQSVDELAMIESLDAPRRRLLQCFVEVKPVEESAFPSLRNILKYGKHELTGYARIPLYKRKGDDNGYLGDPLKHWMRYTFNYGQYLKIGFIGSKDAGEPFFKGRNAAGYDFYSAYALVRTKGLVNTLVVGRYRLRFGMGLVMNNDYSFGKLGTLAVLGRNTDHISGHSSRSEANYLQGAAVRLALTKHISTTVFASYRPIDATMNKDSTTIATILETGYHRTPSEMNRRRNAMQTALGARLYWSDKGFHVGLSGIYTSFDHELRPDTLQLFRRWRPRGSRFYNLGVDYGYQNHRLLISGETATGDGGALATLNTMSYQLLDNLTLIALQRFYSYRYYGLFATSFSESGSVQNESGYYIGASWTPLRNLRLMWYSDYASMPWARYRVSKSSHAWDHLVQATWIPGAFNLNARYRLHRRRYDNAEKTMLIPQTEHRVRLSATYTSAHWQNRVQTDWAYTKSQQTAKGWMLTEYLNYQSGLFKGGMQVAWFHTDSYDSRVYAYEPGLLYTFSFPSFYGHGMRYMLHAQADVTSHLRLIAQVGHTHYTDRDGISSGLQQIDGRSQTDIDLQIRWKF